MDGGTLQASQIPFLTLLPHPKFKQIPINLGQSKVTPVAGMGMGSHPLSQAGGEFPNPEPRIQGCPIPFAHSKNSPLFHSFPNSIFNPKSQQPPQIPTSCLFP